MTDAEVLAKVRQAAEACLHTPTMGGEVRPVAISARVALAMVEQYEEDKAQQAIFEARADEERTDMGAWYGGAAKAYQHAAARIMSALRAAVGE